MKRFFSFFLLLLIALMLIVGETLFQNFSERAKAATTYYVATTGNNDTGDGSSSAPWATINYAATQVSAGDTINAGAGTYSESVSINVADITITGAGETSIIDANGTGNDAVTFNAGGGRISNFIIQGSSSNGISVMNVDNVTISDNIIASNTSDGIYIYQDSDTINIAGNTIRDNGNFGIQATTDNVDNRNDELTITNNTIYDNGNHGMYIDPSTNATIRNNTIYGNTGNGIGVGSALTSVINFRNNIVMNNGNDGMDANTGNTITLSYNDFFGNTTGSYEDITAGATDFSVDPLFRDAANADFIVPSNSPVVDAGDPLDSYSSEPAPNGSRINVGANGNSTLAATSLSGSVTDVYVDATSGNDTTGDGSSGSPYKTLWMAVGQIAPGGGLTIHATSGSSETAFTETLNLVSVHSGASGNLNTVSNWSGQNAPVINASGKTNGASFDNTDYFTFSNFTIQNATADGIYLQNDSDNITLSALTIHDSGDAGIESAVGSETITVSNSTIYSNTGRGIYLVVANSSTINDNTIYSNGTDGIHVNSPDEASVYNNVVYNNTASGIVNAGGTNVNVYNNVIYGHTAAVGVSFATNAATGTITNNSFYNNLGGIHFNNNGGAVTATVQNNIVYASASGSWGFYFDTGTTLTGLTSDYNNIYTVEGAHAGLYNATNYTSLSDWQTLTSKDANSINVDPSFVSTTSGSENFRLGSGSGSIDAGTTVALVTNDIAGTSRYYGSAYDQGAYEIDNTAPAISSLSPASAATDVAADSNITFRITDADSGVDNSTLTFTVNSQSATPDNTAVSAPNTYDYSYNPSTDFSEGSTVTVAVSVDDNASTANSLSTSWSFTIAAAATPVTSPSAAGGSPSSSSSSSSTSSSSDDSAQDSEAVDAASSDDADATSGETEEVSGGTSGGVSEEGNTSIGDSIRSVSGTSRTDISSFSDAIADEEEEERSSETGFSSAELQNARSIFRKLGQKSIENVRYIYRTVAEIAFALTDITGITVQVKESLASELVSISASVASLQDFLNVLAYKIGGGWGIASDTIIIGDKDYFENQYFKTFNFSKSSVAFLNSPWMRILSGTYEPFCGNGILESGEQCDDGNFTEEDGCSSVCETDEEFISYTTSASSVAETVIDDIVTDGIGDDTISDEASDDEASDDEASDIIVLKPVSSQGVPFDDEEEEDFSSVIDDEAEEERTDCNNYENEDLLSSRSIFRKLNDVVVENARFVYDSLAKVAATVSEQTGISIQVKPNVANKLISIKSASYSLQDFLDNVADKVGVEWGISGDHIIMASSDYFEDQYYKTVDLSEKTAVYLDCPWIWVMGNPSTYEDEDHSLTEEEESGKEDLENEDEGESEEVGYEEDIVDNEDESSGGGESEETGGEDAVNEGSEEVGASDTEDEEIKTEEPVNAGGIPETNEEISIVNSSSSVGGGYVSVETPLEVLTSEVIEETACDAYSGSNDADDDGLSDQFECLYGTDPNKASTNGEHLDSEIVIDRIDLVAATQESVDEDIHSSAPPATVSITNWGGGAKTSNGAPLFKGVATPTSGTVCLYAENETGVVKELGCTMITENNKFLFKTPENLIDGTYIITAKVLETGEIVASSKEVVISINSAFIVNPPRVQRLGDQIIPLSILNTPDKLKNFRIRLKQRKPILHGTADYKNTVFVDWQSAIFSSALIADTAEGAFSVSAPSELKSGEHTLWTYAVNAETGVRSSEVELHFTVAEPASSAMKRAAAPVGVTVLLLAAAYYYVWIFKPKKVISK